MLPQNLPNVRNAKLPAAYESARAALAKCEKVDECADWADKAAALASYAKQSDDKTLYNMAIKIRARAIRRCGALLKAIEAGQGGRQKLVDPAPQVSRSQAARDAGLSRDRKNTALRVASVEDPAFEAAVERERPATIKELAAMGTKAKPKPLVDLKGRDPEEFAQSTQAQGHLREMLAFTASVRMKAIVRGAFEKERVKMRLQAEAIAAWCNKLIEEIGRIE